MSASSNGGARIHARHAVLERAGVEGGVLKCDAYALRARRKSELRYGVAPEREELQARCSLVDEAGLPNDLALRGLEEISAIEREASHVC
jgi:hypothetical protein